MMLTKTRIDVSPEMLSFVGPGAVPAGNCPEDSILLSFAGIGGETLPVFSINLQAACCASHSHADLIFLVQRDACRRIFDHLPVHGGAWHMPSNLRVLALSIRDCEVPEATRTTLQLARSVELLCESFAEMARGELVAFEGSGALSQRDSARIAAARRMIDDRWQEKLTLESIGRACGLNRDKLSRGFREIYNSTVSDMLAHKRLDGARQLLIATELPVAIVGYRCGYLNNASFSRAFSRRFGIAPSQFRQARIAA